MKQALVVWGGMELHEPEAGARIVQRMLEESGYAVTVSNDSEALGVADAEQYDLIVPQVTGGELSREASIRLCAAIEKGTGFAAFHHGGATSFQGNARFRFLSGCTFATHPGDIITYRVDPIKDDPILAGITPFEHTSEQYYMHVDPSVEVIATTTFSGEHAFWKKGVAMPVVYKSRFGNGRVFYSALGHKPAEIENNASIATILQRGLLWASR